MDPFTWIRQTRDGYRVLGVILGGMVATMFVLGFWLFAMTVDRGNASAQMAFAVIVVPGCYGAAVAAGFQAGDRLFNQRYPDA